MRELSRGSLQKTRLRKPDGRELLLYGRGPIAADLRATGAVTSPDATRSHLRWHPLRGEWVAYATHRQDRTFLPGPSENPLAPSRDPARPSEVPAGDYDVAVFENRFPTLSTAACASPAEIVPTRPGTGRCEVVVYTQDPKASLGALPLWHVELLMDVWTDRWIELGASPGVEYVFPFENRGEEVGVTLTHPHGQIYAYPFIPPVAQRELAEQRRHIEEKGVGLLAWLLDAELADGRRILYDGESAVAFVPVCARYAYEVWIAPRRAAPSLADLDEAEKKDLARALKLVLLKLDGLWSRPFPYVLVFHQAPTDGRSHPEAHVHLEIYPPYRSRQRLKYLAGSELGAGVFTADTLPEDRAAELRGVSIEPF